MPRTRRSDVVAQKRKSCRVVLMPIREQDEDDATYEKNIKNLREMHVTTKRIWEGVCKCEDSIERAKQVGTPQYKIDFMVTTTRSLREKAVSCDNLIVKTERKHASYVSSYRKYKGFPTKTAEIIQIPTRQEAYAVHS